ncbi:YbdK family carboxylate-amine ligase [Uliginosibacterium sp. 31-16]|uniref:YbdK family carboxylate-amine ligase n=1 Tax=Uliginosibacterium sp. 31-16 TaxID=3068315 RepID=UPI00273D45C4|nr:YbdK family carboxylate-amine ligase [Uliginosibacterium sp. 31-16]MDP5237959.1 YbdK family carboxylate-amine ligase [Uliginosibacterium sp. 31-16]
MTDTSLEFTQSAALSLGVELELQIISRLDGDLTGGATELLALIERKKHRGDFKPEMTESMIEVSTGVHHDATELGEELLDVRQTLLAAADKLNLLISGGGAHPFQHWAERKIFDKPRFHQLGELYGYLAKQFTVFGQHIHVGCPNGDEAIFLLHGLSRFLPHFIALSAASPYYQGVDTAFESSRLNAISAFPLSGRAPLVKRWSEFVSYYDEMKSFGVVESMKDFYWDIRPKPEFGTVEIRICDTPLTIQRATELAAYAQTVCRYLLVERPFLIDESLYAVYTFNRFQAARFGFDGGLIDPASKQKALLREDFLATLDKLMPHAAELGTSTHLLRLRKIAEQGNDTRWMRDTYARSGSLPDLVWEQARLWRDSQ